MICAATCTSITISDLGLFSGTYREIESTYDDETHYYMAGGVDFYELYKYDGAWNLEPAVAQYPRYRVSRSSKKRCSLVEPVWASFVGGLLE